MLHIPVESETTRKDIFLDQMGISGTPKEMGRMGIKSLSTFSTTMAAKLGWKLVTSHSP